MSVFENVMSTASQAGGEQVRRLGSESIVSGVAAASSHLARLLVDVALGDVLGRPDLDARTRELLAVAMLTALGSDPGFVAVHTTAALEAGASAEELMEVLTQVVTFAGFPTVLHALPAVRKALADKGLDGPFGRSARAVVVEFFDALGAGDTERAVGMASDDAIWSVPGDPSQLPWVGQHRGREAITRFYSVLGAETDPQGLSLGPIVAHGEQVFVRGEFTYGFPRHGGWYSGAFVIVFTVRDGLIQRYEMHEDSLGMARAFQNAS